MLTGSQGQQIQWEWATPPNGKFQGGEQEEFFRFGPSPLVASGGFNSGKTVIAIFKLLYLADKYPGYRTVIARRFASELRQTTLQTFYSLCPPEAIKSKNEGGGHAVVTLHNGSRFIFMHLNRPDASSILRGLEVNAALLDQAEEIHEEVYDILEARLGRWQGVIVPPAVVEDFEASTGQKWPYRSRNGRILPPSYMLLTCNPDLETHWIWRRFHPNSEEWQAVWKAEGYNLLTFDSRRNKFASEDNLRILLRKDDAFQARYVRGEWGNPEGVFFKVSPSSIIEPSEALSKTIRESCRLWRVLDHGDTGVTCCLWFAVNGANDIFCVSPETRVLTSDLRWITAGSVAAGDDLAGFDEEVSETGRRRWRRATVETTERLMLPCYRLKLSDGTEVVCSSKHRWLARSGNSGLWQATEDLPLGARLMKVSNTWNTDLSYGAGYLAGAYDGEGSLFFNDHGTLGLGLSQKDNQLLAQVRYELDVRGIRYGVYQNRADIFTLAVTRKRDILKLVGSVRPKRLLPKFDIGRLGGFRAFALPTVVEKEYVGVREVVAMKTSTGTYVAEGLASHNCFREYYVEDATVRDHRKNIALMSKMDAKETGEKPSYRNLADPSIFNKTPARIGGRNLPQRWTVANEYADSRDYPAEDAIHFDPADNSEEASRERIRDLLHIDKNHTHPITGERGAPHLYFVKRTQGYQGCFHAITEVRSARRIQVGSLNGRPVFSDERDEGVPDHALDCVRYLAMARASPFHAKKMLPGNMTWEGYAKLAKQNKLMREKLDLTFK